MNPLQPNPSLLRPDYSRQFTFMLVGAQLMRWRTASRLARSNAFNPMPKAPPAELSGVASLVVMSSIFTGLSQDMDGDAWLSSAGAVSAHPAPASNSAFHGASRPIPTEDGWQGLRAIAPDTAELQLRYRDQPLTAVSNTLIGGDVLHPNGRGTLSQDVPDVQVPPHPPYENNNPGRRRYFCMWSWQPKRCRRIPASATTCAARATCLHGPPPAPAAAQSKL